MSYRLILCAALLLISCSGKKHEKHQHHERTKYLVPMIYSPNGEPLNGAMLGNPTCEDALSKWFAKVSMAGAITQKIFLADAKAQFKRMDIDRNGYLVSEELDRYRLPYRLLMEGKKPEHLQEDTQKSLIDPVMAADANLDFKVTLEEFLADADKTFYTLDADHNRKLSKEEILKLCVKE